MVSTRAPRKPAVAGKGLGTTVPRIPLPTRDELMTTIVDAARPVIIEGAIKNWTLTSPPLTPKELTGKLAALAGKREVLVASTSRAKRGLFSYEEQRTRGRNYSETQRPFGEFVAELHKPGPALYMRSEPMRDSLPELVPYFELELLRGQRLFTDTPRLWLGNGGHRVATHYDRDDNLLCMAAGHKRLMMYPPSALPGMYIGGFGFEPGATATSLVDPLEPDHARFPRFKDVEHQVHIADIGPGDALYIPANWWHHVESHDLNVAVAFWWCRTTIEQRLGAESAFAHGLLALRSLPPHLRSVYRAIFDYFVFEQHGDPYAHIDEADQGWAGRPTPDRERELKKKFRSLIDGSGLLEGGETQTIDLRHKHQLVTGVSFHVSGDNIEIHDNTNVFPLVVPYEVFELLREFRSPAAPTKVAKKRCPKDAAERRDLEQLCRALVVRGLLVDCEATS